MFTLSRNNLFVLLQHESPSGPPSSFHEDRTESMDATPEIIQQAKTIINDLENKFARARNNLIMDSQGETFDPGDMEYELFESSLRIYERINSLLVFFRLALSSRNEKKIQEAINKYQATIDSPLPDTHSKTSL